MKGPDLSGPSMQTNRELSAESKQPRLKPTRRREDKRSQKEVIHGMSRMKKPMPIRPKARKVSFCQLFLMYKRKTKLVMTAAMQVPRARPVQMKLICLFGTPTFRTKVNSSYGSRHCFFSRLLTWVARKGCVGPRTPMARPRQTWPAQARGRQEESQTVSPEQPTILALSKGPPCRQSGGSRRRNCRMLRSEKAQES